MNLKKKVKGFFTLTCKSEGFTLVELIVVIAILAILAGVAVPAYNGYIKKADRSADDALLNEINTAFASACMANGEPNVGRTDVKGGITAKKFVYTAPFETDFAKFFEGEAVEFKVMTQLYFSPSEGRFVSDLSQTSGSILANYGNGVLELTVEDLAALKNTVFIDSLGVDGLLDKVSDVTGFAALMTESTALQTVLGSDAFLKHAASAMGVDTSKEDWMTDLGAKADGLIAQMQANNPELYPTWDAAYNQLMANAAVLHAAKNATDANVMTKADITSLLATEGASTVIKDNLEEDPSKALSQAAVAYGMYTAYAHSTGDEELIASTENPLYILKGLDDAGFREWIANEGQTDLDGYLSAMTMINNSSKDTEAVSTLLVNGYNDPELAKILGDALNQ